MTLMQLTDMTKNWLRCKMHTEESILSAAYCLSTMVSNQ
jgi:hypothetical protein